MYTNASCSKYTSRRPIFLNRSLIGKPNFHTKKYTVPKRTEDSPNAKPLHPKTGTPPTPDTAFPSMGPKWTARRFVIDPPDDERGPDVGGPLALHMHICDMYILANLSWTNRSDVRCDAHAAIRRLKLSVRGSLGLSAVCLPGTCMHGWQGGSQVSQSAARCGLLGRWCAFS